MHYYVGNDTAHDNARCAHEHYEYAFPHYFYDSRYIDFDQHQYDEYRQDELAKAGVDNRLIGYDVMPGDSQVAEKNRRRVDK